MQGQKPRKDPHFTKQTPKAFAFFVLGQSKAFLKSSNRCGITKQIDMDNSVMASAFDFRKRIMVKREVRCRSTNKRAKEVRIPSGL